MKAPALAAAAAFGVLALGAGAGLRRAHQPRFPPLSELAGGGPFVLQDAALASAGFRALAADLAWIQLLQYGAGVPVAGLQDEPGRPYSHLKALSLRVARLDPSFYRAYLYGAGMLGWFRGIERPDEAADILAEGMRRSPERPHFALYLAALAYKRQGDNEKMIAALEASFDHPDTPTVMKAILANIRQSRGELREALSLWERIIANDRDAAERPRAKEKAAELRALIRARRQ